MRQGLDLIEQAHRLGGANLKPANANAMSSGEHVSQRSVSRTRPSLPTYSPYMVSSQDILPCLCSCLMQQERRMQHAAQFLLGRPSASSRHYDSILHVCRIWKGSCFSRRSSRLGRCTSAGGG